jgi:RNA polymerase sigma-70 factor, ECF subfamily
MSDPERFEAIVAEHQGWVRAYLRSLGVDGLWVDDVAQEVFLTAFRRWAEYQPDRPLGAWLRGIAKHLAVAERRRSGRRARVISTRLTEALAAVDDDPEQPAHAGDELHAALARCLDRLPPRARELLHQRYAEELDAAQIAAAQGDGANANAIRQTLHRLRDNLRRCLAARLGGAWT